MKKNIEIWEPLTPVALQDLPEGVSEMWESSLYVVIVRNTPCGNLCTNIKHLSFRRKDRGTFIDWRHKQYLKNQICGEECEAVEIFPAESRLVDTSNQFHLWVFPKGFRLPFGYGDRLVLDGGVHKKGFTQRMFEPHMIPKDAEDLDSFSFSKTKEI